MAVDFVEFWNKPSPDQQGLQHFIIEETRQLGIKPAAFMLQAQSLQSQYEQLEALIGDWANWMASKQLETKQKYAPFHAEKHISSLMQDDPISGKIIHMAGVLRERVHHLNSRVRSIENTVSGHLHRDSPPPKAVKGKKKMEPVAEQGDMFERHTVYRQQWISSVVEPLLALETNLQKLYEDSTEWKAQAMNHATPEPNSATRYASGIEINRKLDALSNWIHQSSNFATRVSAIPSANGRGH